MLLTSKNWRIKAEGKVSEADTLLSILLQNRGIGDPQEIEQFLSDDVGFWHDPFLYNDMRKAVDIINDIIDSHGRVLVYGDYDCDGVTATAILVRYFRSHNCDVRYIVPHRSEHGYGLTEKIMDKVIEEQPNLVITVDCGVTNLDTVAELKERGIKVIVTDHHNVKDELPDADCVICAKRPDNTYPFTELCGAGVALKVVEALGKDGRHGVNGNLWRQAIELAGLATIADLVSVTDENRTIIKRAFKSMENPSNTGVKVMNDMLLFAGKTLDETFISFNVVPRINAAGRLYDSSDALKLFLENNPSEAKKAAQDLTRENDERKEIEAKVFEEARMQLENPDRPEKWSLTNTCGPVVVYGKNWHQGVLGIVAGKLAQYYGRSALVFTDDATEPGCAKGSGRAFGEFDLFKCLEGISDKLVNFGGHKKAAGMLVRKEGMGAFMEALEDEAKRISEAGGADASEDADNSIEVECELVPSAVNFDSYREICRLRPFGIGNTKPNFVTKDLVIEQTTDYPWDGRISIDIKKVKRLGTVVLHIPSWAESYTLHVNGEQVDNTKITRKWKKGDRIELVLSMTPRLVEANPLVEEAKNQVAVMRGPIVYCLEGQDIEPTANGKQPKARINDIAIPADIRLTEKKITLAGHEMIALEGDAIVTNNRAWDNQTLYRTMKPIAKQKVRIRLIPYYAWDNRGIDDMSLWLLVSK